LFVGEAAVHLHGGWHTREEGRVQIFEGEIAIGVEGFADTEMSDGSRRTILQGFTFD